MWCSWCFISLFTGFISVSNFNYLISLSSSYHLRLLSDHQLTIIFTVHCHGTVLWPAPCIPFISEPTSWKLHLGKAIYDYYPLSANLVFQKNKCYWSATGWKLTCLAVIKWLENGDVLGREEKSIPYFCQ